MNRMNKIILVLSTIFVIIGYSGCSDNKKETVFVHVTYKVVIDSPVSHPVFVAYKDSTGYVTFQSNTNWTKEVYLPRKTVASLLIISLDGDTDYDADDIGFISAYNDSKSFLAEIITEGKTVMDRNDGVASVSLYIP